jgi:pseudouridine-5'-phosphate glycosidase
MNFLALSPAVAAALDQGAPVVALESTVITHGMPWPRNLETARLMEADVRAEGATPAIVAVLDGILHVGLKEAQLEALARARDVAKLSRADLAVWMAQGKTGGTTVAATMISAHLAGIAVFATGGIGGVHRGAEDTFDISADLQEMAQTPITVVCAGAKAILDLSKTFEVLETLGVPVIAFGQDEVPGFWSASTGYRAPLRMDSPAQIAQAHQMRARLGLAGGQLIANPIPAANEIPLNVLEPLIRQAQAEADARKITGKPLTPFLLRRLNEMTEGRTLAANIALLRNNARLAAQIALCLRG